MWTLGGCSSKPQQHCSTPSHQWLLFLLQAEHHLVFINTFAFASSYSFPKLYFCFPYFALWHFEFISSCFLETLAMQVPLWTAALYLLSVELRDYFQLSGKSPTSKPSVLEVQSWNGFHRAVDWAGVLSGGSRRGCVSLPFPSAADYVCSLFWCLLLCIT